MGRLTKKQATDHIRYELEDCDLTCDELLWEDPCELESIDSFASVPLHTLDIASALRTSRYQSAQRSKKKPATCYESVRNEESRQWEENPSKNSDVHKAICGNAETRTATSDKDADENCPRTHLSALGPEPRRTVVVYGSDSVALVFITSSRAKVVKIIESGEVSVSSNPAEMDVDTQNWMSFVEQRASNWQLYNSLCKGTLEQDCFKNQTGRQLFGDECLRRIFNRMKLNVDDAPDSSEIFKSWEEHFFHDSTCRHTIPKKTETDTLRVCLICFDPVDHDDDIQYLVPCGHCVCGNCWVEYVKSMALSGQCAQIFCPGNLCLSSINLLDAGHILFRQGTAMPSSEADDLFRRLVSVELENFVTLVMQGRHCASPSCARLLPPVPKINSNIKNGWTLLQCLCGHIQCGMCTMGAHPGLSCKTHKEMLDDIASGRADAEYQTQLYLLKKAHPCPRCNSAIERNGGCNHLRCTKCQYYFCWHCGGPGNDCMAYRCLNSGKFWHEHFISPDSSLRTKVELYRSYRSSDWRLKQLDQAIRSFEGKMNTSQNLDSLLFEHQICKFIMWLQAWRVQFDYREHCSELDKLEVILHAHKLRQSKLHSAREISVEQRELSLFRERPKILSKRKEQWQKELRRVAPDRGFTELVADSDLRDLCSMDSGSFERTAFEEAECALRFLHSRTMGRKQGRRRRKTANAETHEGAFLNKKLNRSKDPWKNGMKVTQQYEEPEKKIPWKGRIRVNILRQLHEERKSSIME